MSLPVLTSSVAPRFGPVELLSTALVTMSLTAMALIVGKEFRPLVSLQVGLALAAGVAWWRTRSRGWQIPRTHWWLIAAMTLFALVFRSQPYLYVLGGQDQGAYVEMSASLDRNRSVFVRDELRAHLPPHLLAYYDANNQQSTQFREPGYEGGHFAGQYISDLSRSLYVFQFYPLQPAWMSMAGSVIGGGNRVYGLVFLSLVSILYLALLTFQISGRERDAWIVAALLTLNPGHAYLAKYPLSEEAALAFAAAAFYHLAHWYRSASSDTPDFGELALSVGLFACLFFTRISGFVYLPIFVVILFVAMTLRSWRTLPIVLTIVGAVIAYGVTVAYGWAFSHPYALDIYSLMLSGLGSHWEAIGIAVPIFVVALSIAFPAFFPKVASRILQGAALAPLPLLIVAAATNLYLAFLLGFHNQNAHDSWVGEPALAGLGWTSLGHCSAFVLLVYVTPFGIAANFVFIELARRSRELLLQLFSALLVFGCAYVFIVQPFARFQYHYVRYLMTEAIPFSLVAFAIVLGRLCSRPFWRWGIIPVLISVFAYDTYYCVAQLRGSVATDAAASLSRIAQYMDRRDVLIIDAKDFPHMSEIPAALESYYGLTIFRIPDLADIASEAPAQVKAELFEFLRDYADEVFLLSRNGIEGDAVRSIEVIPYAQSSFELSGTIPSQFKPDRPMPINLYRIDSVRLLKTTLHAN